MKRCTLLMIGCVVAGILSAQNRNFIDQPYIEVTGRADTLVAPDEIFINLILSEKDVKDRISLEELEQKMIASLKTIGIDTEKNLSLSDLSSNFRFHLLKDKSILKTKIYTLKVGNAILASNVFIALEEIGISNVTIERLAHSSMKMLKNTMRTKAVLDAKDNAIAMVQPLGQQVGPAIHITNSENNMAGMPGQATAIRIRGAAMLQQDKFKELPAIEFDKIKVSAEVSVKFILR